MRKKDRITYLEDRLRFLTRELCETKAFQQKMWEAANPPHEDNRIPEQVCVTAPKPIDWSKVSPIVPVKVWDEEFEEDALILYRNSTHMYARPENWERRSLITGIDIAWHGGKCPLPEGVEYVATLRSGSRTTVITDWGHDHGGHRGDVISFRVTGIADGWTEEVNEVQS